MLKLLVSCAVALTSFVTSASAQEAERADSAFNVFKQVCVAMRDERAAAMDALIADNWVRVESDALPRPSRGRGAEELPAGTQVYAYPDQPQWLFVHFVPQDSNSAAAPCAAYAVGVSSAGLAQVLYPGPHNADSRRAFVGAPLAFGSRGDVPYFVSATSTARVDESFEERYFAYFGLVTIRENPN